MSEVKVKLMFTMDEKVFFKFYWFEMKDDHFYWGSSYKSRGGRDPQKFNGEKVTLNIPEDFESREGEFGKFSFHKSGHTHYKITTSTKNEYFEKEYWGDKGLIFQPTRFFWLISKALKFYDSITNNPMKGRSSVLALKLRDEDLTKRFYMEFFLSPAGEFQIPKPVIKTDDLMPNILTHSLNDNLILVIRYAFIVGFEMWRPEIEMVFVPEYLK